MKNLPALLLLTLLSSGINVWAQWSGSSPSPLFTNQNVGIGTNSPRSPLEVRTTGNNTTIQSGLILQQYNPGSPNNSAGIALDFGIGNNGSNNNIEGAITLKETYWGANPKFIFSLWDVNNAMQDRMVIDTHGNVGIGTTTPTAPLDLYQQGDNASISTVLRISQGNSGSPQSGTGVAIEFASGDNYNAPQTLGKITTENTYWDGKSRMRFATKNGSAGLTDQMVIDDVGNVGIGINNPQSKLDVNGALNIGATGVSTPSSGLNYGLFPHLNVGLGVYSNNGGISFWGGAAPIEYMRIASGGNVGIGTTSPDAKLTVSGQVHATEVKVTLNAPGPDYVFEKDYQLRSLEETKSYIDKNKHLPEVPSTKEMEANGINLSEMNMLLLKKVEELTLYVIELKEENKSMKDKMNTIYQNINQIKK